MQHTLIAGLAALLLAPFAALYAAETTVTVSNTEPRRDTRGEILDARDGGLERLKGKEAEVPSYETVSALFPLPGTKRIYLHQPCDTMIVEARPDLKLMMKRALGGGPVTGLGFVLSGAGQEGNFDYTRTRQQFEEQAFPLLKQTVAQAGFVFEQTAFTTTDDSDRRLVMIRLRVTPESGAAADALALAWLSVAQPQHLFYSHGNEDYIVFEPWGAAWGGGLDLQVENNVQHDGKTVFAVFRTGKNVSLAQAENPRLKKHLVVKLDFRQTKEAVIEVCVPYASGPGTPWPPDKAFRLDEAPKLIALSFDKEYARQAGQWRALGERAAKISVPEALVNQIYRTLTLNNLQFLGSAPGVAFCKPGQGGFSTFSTVYGWESSNFLTVMDRQGFHDEIRRVLDFFLTTQQGSKGQGPNGDISTAEGSFRPHIHWMCESGAILRVFAEHALSAGDADGLRRDSPALLKAARWIQHERSRTKEIGADGKKVPYYGLMPKGLATDWPDYVYSFWTDAYTWQGLDRLATADLYYVNLGEKSWQRIWLERGERLKALRFFYATLAYSTSRDVHMVHERYCPQLPWLLPWQPNASGNGRVLEMILNTLLFEKGDSLCLLYGVPDAWFAAGKPLGISGLSLTSGNFSFSVKPQPQPGSYVFSYEWGNQVPAKFLLALPSGSGRETHRIVEIAGQNRKSATHIIPATPQ